MPKSGFAANSQGKVVAYAIAGTVLRDSYVELEPALVEALLYAALLTLIVSRRLLQLVRETLRVPDGRVPTHRWAVLLESVSLDLLDVAIRPPRELKRLLPRLSRTLLHEALDPNVGRLGLLRAVEQRAHAYRNRAQQAAVAA